MTTTEFCYWLNGYIELGGERPSESQWEMVKEHLLLVFKKETNPLRFFTPKSEFKDISYCFSEGINKIGDSIDFKNVHGKYIIEHSC